MSEHNNTQDNRPIRYMEERTADDGTVEEVVVYRASGLGTCTRAFVAHANGHPPMPTPKWLLEVFAEGHAFEERIINMYVDKVHGEADGSQNELELELGTIAGRRVVIRGHIDGTVTLPDGSTWLLEVKKVRDSGWKKFEREGVGYNPNYQWQVSVYQHALDVVGTKFVGGHVVDTGGEERELTEVCEHTYTEAPRSLREIRARVREIEGLIAKGFDAPEVPCTKNTYPCPFLYLHDPEPEEETFEWPDDEEVKILLDGRSEVSVKISALEKQVKQLKATRKQYDEGIYDLIKHYGEAADTAKKLVGHGYVVTRTRSAVKAHMVSASTRDYISVKRIKEEGTK